MPFNTLISMPSTSMRAKFRTVVFGSRRSSLESFTYYWYWRRFEGFGLGVGVEEVERGWIWEAPVLPIFTFSIPVDYSSDAPYWYS